MPCARADPVRELSGIGADSIIFFGLSSRRSKDTFQVGSYNRERMIRSSSQVTLKISPNLKSASSTLALGIMMAF